MGHATARGQTATVRNQWLVAVCFQMLLSSYGSLTFSWKTRSPFVHVIHQLLNHGLVLLKIDCTVPEEKRPQPQCFQFPKRKLGKKASVSHSFQPPVGQPIYKMLPTPLLITFSINRHEEAKGSNPVKSSEYFASNISALLQSHYRT